MLRWVPSHEVVSAGVSSSRYRPIDRGGFAAVRTFMRLPHVTDPDPVGIDAAASRFRSTPRGATAPAFPAGGDPLRVLVATPYVPALEIDVQGAIRRDYRDLPGRDRRTFLQREAADRANRQAT
jgi:hypothetical protein